MSTIDNESDSAAMSINNHKSNHVVTFNRQVKVREIFMEDTSADGFWYLHKDLVKMKGREHDLRLAITKNKSFMVKT